MPVAGRCLLLLLLSACVALLLQPPLGARGAPLEPVYPGDNATPEQMAQYAAELRRYINMLTRPRYGKRDREETLDILEWGSPHAAAARQPPDGSSATLTPSFSQALAALLPVALLWSLPDGLRRTRRKKQDILP
ncbi:pancreatic polypeptide prohormone [Crocuta crocuta]